MAQLHQISSQFIFIAVNLGFHVFHTFYAFFTVFIHQTQCCKQCIVGFFCHFSCCIAALLYCKCRFLQETRLQDHKLSVLCRNNNILFFVPDCKTGKFLQSLCKRKENDRCSNIKYTVDNSNSCRCCCLMEERKSNNCIYKIEYSHKDNRTDQIEIQMYCCCTFCILLGSDCRKDCSNTGSDVLSHNDRDCCTERYCTCKTQGLQNTYGCRR